jgi:hypothetical protein
LTAPGRRTRSLSPALTSGATNNSFSKLKPAQRQATLKA